MFVPANNSNVNRDVGLIVTNVSPFAATVDIVDDDADGDSDDSALGVVLEQGQSWVRFIKEGEVNDDAGGKWDGDYFHITSSHPVVAQMATKSDWQWDFAPSDNKTMRGQSFFLFSPATSFSQRDLNLVAYEDDTEIQVLDITVSALSGSGITSVDLSNSTEILKAVLDEGEDLIGRQGLGTDIFDPGRTYWVRASKGVTCQYGSLVGNSRDGGGFVPSENGFASGEKFYFNIPNDFDNEREVRVVSFDDANAVQLAGWDSETRSWTTIQQYVLDNLGHGDWVESGTDYPMYRLTCTSGKKVSVFAASWLEAKGLSGTKDIASFASSRTGYGAGKEFQVYIPQPGIQNRLTWDGENLGNASLLYVFGHIDETEFTVVDGDTNGELINKSGEISRGGFGVVRISPSEYSSLNKPSEGLRPYLKLTSNHLVTVMVSNHNDNWMTFAPSVVLPNPILTVIAENQQAVVGQEACIEIVAVNEGAGELSEGEVVMALDPAVTFSSADFPDDDLGAPVITIDEATGGQILTWSNVTISGDGTLRGKVCVSVLSRRPDNSVVRSRDFLSFPVIVSGNGFPIPEEAGGTVERFTAQSSVVLTVDDTAQTAVGSLAAGPSGNAVNVTWLTSREPDLEGFRVYRSTAGDGPFTLLNSQEIAPLGDAISGASYLYRDVPPSPGAVYYYRLEVLTQEDGTSFLGPVAILAEDRTPPAAPTISSIAVGDGTVALTIGGSTQDDDLKGYLIYRSTSQNGVYTRLNEIPLAEPGVYTDTKADNGITYYYKARAVDTNGNNSDYSNILQADMPNFVTHVHTLAYEDQIGPGKNDWDYNDWVVLTETREEFILGGTSSVTMEMECLARGARYQNAFRLRYRVNGTWTLRVRTFADRNSTKPFSDEFETGSGVIDTLLFADTNEALPSAEGDDFTNTLNRQNPSTLGQRVVVNITIGDPVANPSRLRHDAPYDPYLVNQAGEVHQRREGFPDSSEVVTFWPSSPLFGYHLDYVLVVEGDEWYWPLENQKIWSAYPEQFASFVLSGENSSQDWWLPENRNSSFTYNWYPLSSEKKNLGRSETDGEEPEARTLPGADLIANIGTIVSAPPKAFRYDGIGWPADSIVLAGANEEVMVVDANGENVSGWPIQANSFRAAPAVGRLSPGDANLTMITAEETYEGDALIMAWEMGATPSLRWSFQSGASIKAPPVLSDLDGDNSLEILAVSTESELIVLGADGVPFSNSPVSLGEPHWNDKNILAVAPPVLVDLDGDGKREVFVVGPSCDQIFGLDSELNPLLGWPRTSPAPIMSGLSIVHNPSANVFTLLTATTDGKLLSYDQFGRTISGYPLDVAANVTAPLVPFKEFYSLEDTFVLTTTAGRVQLMSVSGALLPGWPRELEEQLLAPPVVGDLDGDAEMEVAVATMLGSVYVFNLDGTLEVDLCFQVPGAIQTSPLLTDMDNDARLEINVVTASGALYRSEGAGQTPLSISTEAIGWGGAGGGSATNSPLEETQFSLALPFATAIQDVLGILLGNSPTEPATIDYDVNLDSAVDAADIDTLR